VRAALISIDGQPRDGESAATICLAGKSLVQRQIDFALAAGAERVILLAEGNCPEEIAVRRQAERAGVKLQTIGSARGLLGVLRATDELLVLAPGLLAEAAEAVDLLGKGNSVLVLPAAQGVAAGFERIDLNRAWAGALVVPGALVERLAELPPDIETAAALLRIALQATVPERRLPDSLLAAGSWTMFAPTDDIAAAEKAWLERHATSVTRDRPTPWLASLVLQRAAFSLLERDRSFALLLVASVVLLCAAVGFTALEFASVGFALLAVGALAAEIAAGFARLAAIPALSGRGLALPSSLMPVLVEATLALCGMLAIDQDWLHRLFPPLVLFGLLRALKPLRWHGLAGLAGDPVVLALSLAVASAFGWAEPAIMVFAMALIVLQAAQSLGKRG